jgi:hypothetical protein
MTDAPLAPARLTPVQLADAKARAQTYADYAAGVPANAEALRENYEAIAFTAEELGTIRAITGPLTLLAIVEEWCPDVLANLPLFAHVSEINPAIDLRVLYRPDHQAVANAYPGPVTGRSHIPTYVLFDREGRELGVLIERPSEITARVLSHAEAVHAELATRFAGVARKDLPAEFLNRTTANALVLRRELADVERAGVVSWLSRTARA